jgi:glycosyltransferase involved in cell wall biosynthesis
VRPLRILHVLRAPVGGLFRHVTDLAREQASRGHAVGVIADSSSGGTEAETEFKELLPVLNLGLTRVPMSRHLGPRDLNAIRRVRHRVKVLKADVLHGHGAKGGAYVRLTGGKVLRVYTPHGGSLHFSPHSPLGLFYIQVERWLAPRTDLFLFESAYGLKTFGSKIGEPKVARVVHNGVGPGELFPVVPAQDAADVVFVGELRRLKGVDVLIDALALLARQGSPLRALLFGDGPDRVALEGRATELGIARQIQFAGPLPARAAFRRGRVLVVPSRAESLPYIVLEAAAASVPIVATNVGGISEIFGPDADALVPMEDASSLSQGIRAALAGEAAERTRRLTLRISNLFTIRSMTDSVLAAYDEAIAAARD